ncbi:M23 family metallopeptidase [Salinisphaera aquimarina]|uniref:M23 family metallopeptidase n=1 Tax=Salinisphaera aquimarina TaxID=2094031 RepID=A0ABV7ETS6_9GAMM
MRCYSLMRAGTVGAIGMGLFVCLAADANTPATHAASRSQTQIQSPGNTAPEHAAFNDTAPPSAGAQDLFSSPQITPWREITVTPGDSLSRVFQRAGLRAKEWIALLALGDKVAPLKTLKAGETLAIRKTPDGRLSDLRYRLDAVDTLAVSRDVTSGGKTDTLRADILHQDSQTRRITASGTVDGSLSRSLAQAGIPARVATELAHIYRYRANLSRNMHPGDRFSVIYDAEFAGDVRVEAGPIIAASITTGGRSLKAFRALDDQGRPGYYDLKGGSYEPSFSRHPVNYSRISSPFDPNRMHPILHIRRPHWGVDMAAPRGTPIRAAANGTVKFVGRKHGYGKLVELQHFDGYSTRYGHMYKFVKGMHDGERIRKGEVIGYVGSTGEATGPHLHFEIRKDGVAHNPLTMSLPEGHPLSARRLAVFTSRIHPLLAQLDAVPGIQNTLIASTANSIRSSNCNRASAVNAALALAPASARDHHSLTDLFCVVAAG